MSKISETRRNQYPARPYKSPEPGGCLLVALSTTRSDARCRPAAGGRRPAGFRGIALTRQPARSTRFARRPGKLPIQNSETRVDDKSPFAPRVGHHKSKIGGRAGLSTGAYAATVRSRTVASGEGRRHMAREIDEAFIEAAVERYQRLDGLLAEFDKAVRGVEVTVSSPDGLVEVLVTADGTIRDVTITGALTGRTNTELSRSVRQAVAAAADEAAWARSKLHAEMFGEHTPLG